MTEDEKAKKVAEEIKAILDKYGFEIQIKAQNQLVPKKTP